MSEKEIFDGVIQNYIAEHTTTEKYYTQKYVDEIKEERDKYKKILDKIKEYIKENACYDEDIKQCCRDLLTDECDYILELLEEIE